MSLHDQNPSTTAAFTALKHVLIAMYESGALNDDQFDKIVDSLQSASTQLVEFGGQNAQDGYAIGRLISELRS